MKLDITKIEQAIEDGWVTKRKHPTADLWILNYSKQTQFEFYWEPGTTMTCRGLIVDEKWSIVSRPLEKFFTLDQLTSMRNKVHHLYGMKFKNMFKGNFRCFDKLDGSLGVLYPLGDKVCVATRGSFESEMAVRATEMLEGMGLADHSKWKTVHGESLLDEMTVMVEIIYPDNQIVVDYKGEEKLVLLAVVDKRTGKDDWSMYRMFSKKFEPAKEFFHVQTLEDLTEEDYNGQEGYVLVFDNGLRVKWKYEEYKRLHRIVTGLSENTVWEWLRDGVDIKDVLKDVPDEFYKWGKEVASRLKSRFNEINEEAHDAFVKYNTFNVSRKELAACINQFKYKGLVFSLADGKSINLSIWQIIKQEMKDEKRHSQLKEG